MTTGYFELIIVPKKITESISMDSDTTGEYISKVHLHFKLTGVKDETSENNDTLSSIQKDLSIKWNSEQIDDFVRKLGFIEDQKVEKPIKLFQQLNQVQYVYDIKIVPRYIRMVVSI